MPERSVSRGPLSYYIDYIAYPIAAGVAFWFDPRPILVGIGCVLFTLAEYWIHRTALHRWFYHGTHERHHLNPRDYVVIWYVPGIFLGLAFALPTAVWSGFVLGYVWFISMHHALHHWDPRPKWLERYARWHDLHHRNVRFNFGITHPLWDWAFGTYKEPR